MAELNELKTSEEVLVDLRAMSSFQRSAWQNDNTHLARTSLTCSGAVVSRSRSIHEATGIRRRCWAYSAVRVERVFDHDCV